MNDKKGFTLIELLAVIVILAVILAIASTAVIKSINDSREKAKYIAAQDIVNIAEAYLATETEGVVEVNGSKCILVEKLVEEKYVESDATNPLTGENISGSDDMREQEVCKTTDQEQDNYKLQEDDSSYFYKFDGYRYKIIK